MNCTICNTAIEKRKIPFGATGKVIELQCCACEADRLQRRYGNTGRSEHDNADVLAGEGL